MRGILEPINKVRRRFSQMADQLWIRLRHPRPVAPGMQNCGSMRFALLTVNYNSTRYLKLLLLSLAEQKPLSLLGRIVIADNNSRDGGQRFLRQLSAACPRIIVTENRRRTHHARGMRSAITALQRYELDNPSHERDSHYLFCDPDVLFLSTDTLARLTQTFEETDCAFAGEFRHHLFPLPEAQASFLAVRRDWAHRPDVSPWVNHGSPAWWMQRDIWKAGGKGADFPNNREGWALHRGRSAVAAAKHFAPYSSYATARNTTAHFMGVKNGNELWDEAASRYASWLEEPKEQELIQRLCQKFADPPGTQGGTLRSPKG